MAATLTAEHLGNPWNTEPGAGPGALLRRAAALALRRLAWWIEHGGRVDADASGLEAADGAGVGEVFDLEAAVDGLAKADLAASTIRKYSGALRRLGVWLDGRPATDALLAEYLGTLADAGRRHASAEQVVAAVARGAREAGAPDACPVGRETRRRLARYERACAEEPPKQAAGIGWEDADRMRDLAAADGNPAGARDAALVAVMSDALLRVSEASALDVGDVTFKADGSARLLIRRGKTDQRGEGAVAYLGAPTAMHVHALLDGADIGSGALFRPVRRGRAGGERLGPGSVAAVVKRRAESAGLTEGVSGHSLRVGSAQSLAARGASLVEMQRDGRWRDPSLPARYARDLEAARGATARLRHGAGGGEGAKFDEKSVASPGKGVVAFG